jgi:hypothetical protein
MANLIVEEGERLTTRGKSRDEVRGENGLVVVVAKACLPQIA